MEDKEKETKLDAYGALDVEKQIWDGKTPIKWEMTANTGHLCIPGPYCLSSYKEIENGKIYINKNGTKYFPTDDELIQYQKLRKQDKPNSEYQLKFKVVEKEMNEAEKAGKAIIANRQTYQNSKHDPKFHYELILCYMQHHFYIHPTIDRSFYYFNDDQKPIKNEILKLFLDNGFKVSLGADSIRFNVADLIAQNYVSPSEQMTPILLAEKTRQQAKEKLKSYQDNIVQDDYIEIIEKHIKQSIEQYPDQLDCSISLTHSFLDTEGHLKLASSVSSLLEKDGFKTKIIPMINGYTINISWDIENKTNYTGQSYIENDKYFLILPDIFLPGCVCVVKNNYRVYNYERNDGHIGYWFKDKDQEILPQTYENLILFQQLFGGEIVSLEELAHHPPATKKEEEKQIETKECSADPPVVKEPKTMVKKEDSSMLPILLAGAGVSALSYLSKGKVSLKKNEAI